jgi:peptide/nickel transport system substrate-binding protein
VNGWAKSPAVETVIAAWFDATTLDQEKALAGRLNKAFLDDVVYAPLGWYLRYYAWRKSLAGVTQGPLPFFWGVSKTV